MNLNNNQTKFIKHLLSLIVEGHEDRGALADLRSGLGKKPGEMGRVHAHVSPFLDGQSGNARWYYVTATLFGLYPEQRRGRTLGAAFRPLRGKSESMPARFVALLNAHTDDLPDHLRHIISLLKNNGDNGQPLDWFGLFDDLLQWDDADGHVQLKWARDFYREN